MPRPEPVLTGSQRARSVAALAAAQQPAGTLPWPDGHTDPWDHVEGAMALLLGGEVERAWAAYAWLAKHQADDGSWATSYDQDRVLDPTIDVNQVAYVAVGVWQWWLLRGERDRVAHLWPMVRRALDFTVSMQAVQGHIRWSVGPDGQVRPEGLLTGSSSMHHALRCGIALGELMGEPQPDWELAAGRLQHAVAQHPELFLDKSRFSMDWYYPVLGGCLSGAQASAALQTGWDTFVVPGLGVRCVSDRPWVTGAETAETALALVVAGQVDAARELLAVVQHLRAEDGAYWTGLVFDEGVRWPGEQATWTVAAMLLADDAVSGGVTRALFSELPSGVQVPAAACLEPGAACHAAGIGRPSERAQDRRPLGRA